MQKHQYTKNCIIAISAAIIAISVVGYSVMAFLNSPKMKLVGIMQKISKIENGEGTYSIDARIHMDEGDADVGIKNGVLFLTRKTDDKVIPENFLNATGQVYAKAEGDRNLWMAAKYINNESGKLILTNDFVLKSVFLDMQIEHRLGDAMENLLSKMFIVSKYKYDPQTQKEALQNFLLKGYELPISEQQHKPTIVITESEIIKMFHTVEENVRADRQKFIKLLQNEVRGISQKEAERLALHITEGEAFKYVNDNFFSKTNNFYFEITFEEKSQNIINISTKLNYSGEITILTNEIKINFDVKTSINYTVMS